MKLFKQSFFTLAMALFATASFAQVKVGSNPTTIDAANNLEVEATNGNKVSILKSAGQLHLISGSGNTTGISFITNGVAGGYINFNENNNGLNHLMLRTNSGTAKDIYLNTGNAGKIRLNPGDGPMLTATTTGVGIGTTTPAFKLQVLDSASTSRLGVRMVKYGNGVANDQVFGIDLASGSASTDATSYDGFLNAFGAFHNGTGTVNFVQGLLTNASNFGSGILNTSVGYITKVQRFGSGPIRNAMGYTIASVQAHGTDPSSPHNAYGIYLPNEISASGGSVNKAWSIYSASTQPSYYAGNVGIGKETPIVKLQVLDSASTSRLGVRMVKYGNGVANDQVFGIDLASGSASTDATSYDGFLNAVNAFHNGTGTVNFVQGLLSNASNFGSGILTNSVGYIAKVQRFGSGPIRNAMGFTIAAVQAEGTDPSSPHNAYGIYLPNVISASGGSVNNAWSIYSGSTQPSYYAGSVGIGTDAPQSTLHISAPQNNVGHPYRSAVTITGDAGSLPRYTAYGAGTSGVFQALTSQGTVAAPSALLNGNSVGGLNFVGHKGDGWATVSTIQAYATANWTATSTPTELRFSSTPDNAIDQVVSMVLNKDGNLGIGTTAPTTKLAVSGTSFLNGKVYLSEAGNDANSVTPWYGFGVSGLKVTYGGFSGHNFYTGASTTTTALSVVQNGNVGIGIDTPTSKLQVVGLPVYANNAAAITAGLTAGAFYHAGDGIVRVVF